MEWLLASVIMTTAAGMSEYNEIENACVGQINGSLLVIISDDTIVYDGVNRSNDALDLTEPRCLMAAYKKISTDFPMASKAYVPCQTLRYAASFAQRKKPVLMESAVEQEDGTLAEHKHCETLEADYLAEAIKDIFLHLTKKCMMLLYSDDNSAYVAGVDNVFIRSDAINVARCYFEGRVNNKSLDQIAQSLSRDAGGFVLIAGKDNAEIIKWSRTMELTNSRTFWIVVTKEDIHVWQSRLTPGERVILLEMPDADKNYCYKLENNTIKRLSSEQQSYRFWVPSLSSSLENVGFWSIENGLVLKRNDVWDFKTFEGKHFIISTLPWPVFHDRKMVDGKLVWTGLCIEILKTLANSLKFTYELIVPPDRKWGAPTKNGTWNGMVGQVLRGEADFAVAKFTITRIRESVIDFTVPFWHESCVMVMRKPEEKSSLIYLGPFRDEVWYSVFLAIPFMASALTGVSLLRAMIYNGVAAFSVKNVVWSLKRSVWFSYGALVQQGCVWLPNSQALRFLVGFWWFFTLVITATYTGNLIAVLAVPKTTLPVNTLQDLVNQNVYKYGVVDDTAIYSMIKLSASKLYKQMWKKSVQYKENLVLSHVEGLSRVAKENYIYLGELGGVAPVVFNNCIYAIGKEEFFPSSFAFVFPEKSPYLPFINKKMNALIENGIIEKWKKEYYPRDLCSLQANEHNRDPASIRDTQGAFFLLSFGVVTATVILLIERLWHVYKRYKINRASKRTHVTHELVIIDFKQTK